MTSSPDKSNPILPTEGLKPQVSRETPAAGTFQSYMQGGGSPPAGPTPARGPAAIGQNPGSSSGQPSLESVGGQVNALQNSMGQVQAQLQDPNLTLKRSQAHLLRNKLSDANDYIRAASTKLGLAPSPPAPSPGGGPVERFLNFLNDGQMQLDAAKQKISELSRSGDTLRPGDLLLVQIKMSQAQQEIEYSSTLLGKIMDTIKTILNTPL